MALGGIAQMLTTVLGKLDAAALGHCQPHEHVFVLPTPASERNPALRIDDERRSIQEVRAYRASGGDSLLDAQPTDAGRDLAALARISRAAGVNIIAVTGYHLPAFYPGNHWIFAEDEAALRRRFEAELLEGVQTAEGRVFPGAVKAAIGQSGPEGRLGACLRAAAGAAATAGVALILHTERGIGAVEAVRICEAQGLDARRVAVCHADRQATDFEVHEQIARTGAFLEYDTIARYKYHDDAQEMRLIAHMLERGYEAQLLFSLDTTAARMNSYEPTAPGLSFLLRSFLPALRASGVSDPVLQRITRENPRRLLASR